MKLLRALQAAAHSNGGEAPHPLSYLELSMTQCASDCLRSDTAAGKGNMAKVDSASCNCILKVQHGCVECDEQSLQRPNPIRGRTLPQSWPSWPLAPALAVAAGLLSVETYTTCDAPAPEQELHELLSVVDIFSPNAAEAASIVGPGTPQQVVQRLLQLGGHLVVLRMGEDGVLLARQQEGDTVETCTVSLYDLLCVCWLLGEHPMLG